VSHRLFCFGAAFLGTGFVTRARVAFVLLNVFVAGGVFAAVLFRFGIAFERHWFIEYDEKDLLKIKLCAPVILHILIRLLLAVPKLDELWISLIGRVNLLFSFHQLAFRISLVLAILVFDKLLHDSWA
tara:strand:+ start:113 stop:496 length:384 start_codon:yes stop_codon:yes gene_type:complete